MCISVCESVSVCCVSMYVYVRVCKHMCVHGDYTLDFEVGSFSELQLLSSIFRRQAASGAVSLKSSPFQGEPQTL